MSHLSSTIGQHFAFASGRSAVLRQLLLSQTDVDRLLGARDRHDVEQILTELRITDMIDQGLNTGNAILQALGRWVHAEVEQMTPLAKRPVFHILWLADDAPLLSTLLKKRHNLAVAEVDTEKMCTICAYDPSALPTYIENGYSGSLPSHTTAFIDEMLALDHPTPREIDAAVAQFVATTQLRLARTSGSSLIRRYVTHAIDLSNIRTALRDYDPEIRTAALLTGGSIPVTRLAGDRQAVINAINRAPLPYNLDESIVAAGDDPIALERACADVIAADIADMWNVPMSIEPVFAFAAIAISNIFLIRTILIAKGNGLSPQETKRILPPFIPATHYVL